MEEYKKSEVRLHEGKIFRPRKVDIPIAGF